MAFAGLGEIEQALDAMRFNSTPNIQARYHTVDEEERVDCRPC